MKFKTVQEIVLKIYCWRWRNYDCSKHR